MTPLLGGLGAALGWACATLCAASSSRRIGTATTLALVMLSGLVLAVPLAAATGWPDGLDAHAAIWLSVSGAANVAGLAFVYAAMSKGEVGIVASITSTEGAIAALIALGDGERPPALEIAGFLPLVVGVALVALGPRAEAREPKPGHRTAVLLAVAAALAFGLNLFAAGQASGSVPIGWVALPARVVGVAILVGALTAGMRPLVGPRLGRIALAGGVFEVLGLLAFAWGARDGIAVTSVLASQFAAISTVGAFLIFGERLVRRQILGVAVLAVGVGMVALGSA